MTTERTTGQRDQFAARCSALSAKHKPQADHPAPAARTRQERLARALDALAREGITGSYAYAPALRGLARMGLIVKPLFFWTPLALFVFGFVLFTSIMGGTALACMALGVAPRPVQSMIALGPDVFLMAMTGLSMLFAGIHYAKARAIRLPRWRDL
ncbi:DUF6404 family protein [Cognatishimia sp. F0-27]|uniref:DUF6404 family protein n=1 Tax=Cognatishimia sp. F0-27 TaxID=2816855 RepID=UPI001D0C74C6|nr:DUF6404 family protein [Cognatishimia sp. F0-27]MCC1494675.1 hypothetical protein [Cognatishimia sp. F0-27]